MVHRKEWDMSSPAQRSSDAVRSKCNLKRATMHEYIIRQTKGGGGGWTRVPGAAPPPPPPDPPLSSLPPFPHFLNLLFLSCHSFLHSPTLILPPALPPSLSPSVTHNSIVDVPGVITHCTPHSIVLHFHTTTPGGGTSNQT